MKVKLTKVLIYHYIRLVYRSMLFVAALTVYIYNRIHGLGTMLSFVEKMPVILGIIWFVFMIEMVLRMFPSPIESPGCQKQFSRNFMPTGEVHPALHDNNSSVLVLIIWLSFNGVIGGLYMSGVIDEDIMLLICLAYSICDIVCILFFCPFETFWLKNKCCGTCRIYNWDFAMMFTPLFFVKKIYTWTLLAASMILLLRWEIAVYRYPERFSEKTNAYLHCENCTEKLCTHKKQLQTLWVKVREQEKKAEARIRSWKR